MRKSSLHLGEWAITSKPARNDQASTLPLSSPPLRTALFHDAVRENANSESRSCPIPHCGSPAFRLFAAIHQHHGAVRQSGAIAGDSGGLW